MLRVTTLTVSWLGDSTPFVRVSNASVQTLLRDKTNPVKATTVTVQSLIKDHTNPVRVTTLQVYVLQSLTEAEKATPHYMELPDMERNPYRPDTPIEIGEISPELDHFMRETQSHIRIQHNLTQVGDTTYPASVMTKVSPTQEFTLGVIGRFFHEELGLIRARYVQFSQMAAADYLNAPVGFFKSSETLDWVVTNDYGKSSPLLAMGIMACFTMPEEGWYGWVIVDGGNVASLGVHEYASYEPESNQGTRFVWYATGLLGHSESGRVLARQTVRGKRKTQIEPGEAYILADGFSDEYIRDLTRDDIEGLQEQVADLTAAIQSLEGGHEILSVQASLKSVKSRLSALADAIATEGKRRADADRNLQDKIKVGVSEQTLAVAIQPIQEALTQLQLAVTQARERAEAAFTLANSVQLGEIQNLLNLFNLTLASHGARIQKLERRLIPLVTGAVPPEFVYLPDGSLVFTEIEI